MLKVIESIVENKDAWIGGKLIQGTSYFGEAETRIKDLQLESKFFHVIGEDFSCGFSIVTLRNCTYLYPGSYLLSSDYSRFSITKSVDQKR